MKCFLLKRNRWDLKETKFSSQGWRTWLGSRKQWRHLWNHRFQTWAVGSCGTRGARERSDGFLKKPRSLEEWTQRLLMSHLSSCFCTQFCLDHPLLVSTGFLKTQVGKESSVKVSMYLICPVYGRVGRRVHAHCELTVV